MPSIERKPRLLLTTASFPNAAETSVELARPESSQFLGNRRDHVADQPYVENFDAGKVAIEFPSTLELNTVFVRKIELVESPRRTGPNSSNVGGNPQGANVIGVDFVPQSAESLFPTGSEVEAGVVFFEDAVGLALGGAVSDTIHRMLANLVIGASQKVRVTLFNGSGAPLNNQVIRATYGLGLAGGDFSLQDIN